MAEEREIKIVIKGDGSAAIKAIGGVQKGIDGMKSGAVSSSGVIKASLVNVAAAYYTVEKAVMGVQKAWALAKDYSGFAEHMATLDAYAAKHNTTAKSVVASIKEISEGLISLDEASQSAMTGLARGLSPKVLIDLALAAKVLKEEMKMSADEAFSKLVQAMTTGKEKALQLATGVIDLKNKYGDQLETLNKVQKAHLMYEEIMKRVKERQDAVKGSSESLQDKMEKLETTFKDLKITLGEGIVRAAAGVAAAFYYLAAGSTGLYAALKKILQVYGELGAANPLNKKEWQQGWKNWADDQKRDAEAAMASREELLKQSKRFYDLMTASSEELQKAMSGGGMPSGAGGGGGDGNATLMQKRKEEYDKLKDSIKQFSASVAEMNPNLSDHEKALQAIDDQYDKFASEVDKAKFLTAEQAQGLKVLARAVADTGKGYKDEAKEAKDLGSSLQGLKAYQDRWTEALQKTYDIQLETKRIETDTEITKIQEGLNERIDGYEQQAEMYADLHDHMLITDQEYYSKLRELNRKALEDKVSILDQEFQKLMQTRLDEIEMDKIAGRISPEEETKRNAEMANLYEKHLARKAEITRQADAELMRINRQAADEMGKEWEQFGRSASDAIAEGMINGFEGTARKLKDLFLQLIADLIKKAILNPIIMPITGQMSGVAGVAGQTVPGVAGYSGLAPGGMNASTFTGSINSFINAGMSILTNVSSTVMSFIGSLAPTSQLLADALSVVAPIAPYIAPLLIAAPLLISLFSQKVRPPELILAHEPTTYPRPEGTYHADEYSGGVAMGETGAWDIAGIRIEFREKGLALAKQWVDTTDLVMHTMEELGLDVSHFTERFSKDIHLEGLSNEEAQAAIEEAMSEAFEVFVGPEFAAKIKGWQKSGESFVDTLSRELTALQAFPAAMDNFDDYIDAVMGTTDAYAQLRDQLQAADESIKAYKDALREMTDPADALEMGNKLKQAIYDRYTAEINFIRQLVQSIKDLKFQMVSLQVEAGQAFLATQQKIDSLTGNYRGSINYITGNALPWLQQQIGNPDNTPQQNLQLLSAMSGAVDAMLSSMTSQIQAGYREWTVTTEGNREAIEAQIDAIEKWHNLLDEVQGTIDNLRFGTTNPQNIQERMRLQYGDVQKKMSEYLSLTGQAKIDKAGELQEAITNYLSMAQENPLTQRPSAEYKAIYDDMIGTLELIRDDALAASGTDEDVQQKIADLQGKIRDDVTVTMNNSDAINAKLRVANEKAVSYYKWIQEQQMKAYKDEWDAKKKQLDAQEDLLGDMVGDLGIEGTIAKLQSDAVTELKNVKGILSGIYKSMTGNEPQLEPEASYAHGTPYVPYDMTARIHRGERITPADQNTTDVVNINFGDILISGTATKDQAREVEDIIIGSINSGRVRQALKNARV